MRTKFCRVKIGFAVQRASNSASAQNGDYLLPAPTGILQSFLQKHGSDYDLFSKPSDGDLFHRVHEALSDK